MKTDQVILIGATPLVKTFALLPVAGSYDGSHNGILKNKPVPWVYAIHEELYGMSRRLVRDPLTPVSLLARQGIPRDAKRAQATKSGVPGS